MNKARVGWATACALGLAVGTAAQASLIVSTSASGAASGLDGYFDFDGLRSTPVGPEAGVTVSFGGTALAAQGSVSGRYAAPYVASGQNALFGVNYAGADQTPYLSTGIGSVELNFQRSLSYIGLLWGSVDTYNTLTLYNGSDPTPVGTLTGSQVAALAGKPANGNQGSGGTLWVDIESTAPFTRVVASSTQYAFELDNVAVRRTPDTGTTLALLGGACALAGAIGRRLSR